MKQLCKKLIADDSGQDLVEYALLAALIGLGAVISLNGIATSIANVFYDIAIKVGPPKMIGP